jgi:hypothetical protein
VDASGWGYPAADNSPNSWSAGADLRDFLATRIFFSLVLVIRPVTTAAGADDSGPTGADDGGPAGADAGAEAENNWAKSSDVSTDALRAGGVAGGPWGVAGGL